MIDRIKKVLPSIVTLTNLVLGFLAITCGDLFIGCMLIVTCLLLDSLDGGLARKFQVQSLIGKELDSLSDMVSFGIAPAVLYIQFSVHDFWFSALAVISFVAGGALRLAKFNTIESKKSFTGLAIPFAALFLVGVLLGFHYDEILFVKIMESRFFYFLVPFVLMIMMNSKLEMFSLKSFGNSKLESTLLLLCIGSFLLLLVLDFKIALPATVLVYIFLSIVQKMLAR